VTDCFNSGNGLHSVHLKEILSNVISKPVIQGPSQTSSVARRSKVSFYKYLLTNQSITKGIQKLINESTVSKYRSTSLKHIDPKVQNVLIL